MLHENYFSRSYHQQRDVLAAMCPHHQTYQADCLWLDEHFSGNAAKNKASKGKSYSDY